MQELDISIIIPTRNRAAWLPTCLAHLEQQTFPAACFEVIVVDDGSTDDTCSVLARYTHGSPIRIRTLSLEPGGTALARNLGAGMAGGTLLVFLADDELASPRLLENHWKVQSAQSFAHCLLGDIHPHPQLATGTLTRLALDPRPSVSSFTELVSYLDAQSSNMSIARSLFARLGGFDVQENIYPLEHVVWAHRVGRMGVEFRRIDDTRTYIWQPANLELERKRFYDMGYAIYNILRELRSRSIVERYPLERSPLEETVSAFLLPFYLRAYQRQYKENPVFSGTLQRKILRHERARGYNDARQNRPRRPPAALSDMG